MATTKIAGLVRVSSAQQAGKGWEIVQRRMIEEACEDLPGFKIVKWYEGVESATKRKRPILDSLLADAERGLWDAVMVYDATRWSRNLKESEEARAHLYKHGKAFYVGRQLIDPREPGQKLTGRVQTAVAEHETDLFRLRVMRKKVAKGADGKWPYGEVPYGRILKRDKGGGETWSIDPKAKENIDRAYRLIVNKRMSLVKVAAALEWPTPQLVRKRLLASGGIGTYTQTDPDSGDEIERRVPIPALLTDVQIAAIKKAWDRNRVSVGKHSSWNNYLLRGKVRCDNCGSVMVGTFLNGRRKYAHVASQWKDKRCVRTWYAQEVEDATMWKIGEALRDRKSLEREIAQQLGDQGTRRAEVERRVRTLESAIAECERKISAKSDQTGIDAPARQVIVRDINVLSRQLEQLQAEHEEAIAELAAIDTAQADAGRIAAHFQHLVGAPSNATRWTAENKRKAVDAAFGDGSLRRQQNVGAYLARDGTLNLVTRQPLSAVVAAVKPDKLGRLRLKPESVRALLATTHRSRRCRYR